jgi:predicted MPP superfamily phosphohydrolase
MENLQLKRKAIELGHLESWLTRGRGTFHFENLRVFSFTVRNALRLTGLLARGERNARKIVIRNIRFEFADLPEEFDGFRILHLSDIHADGLDGLAESIASKVEKIEADLCVMTGDYRFEIYGPCHDVYHNLKKILPCIKSRLGIIGILGNHDFAEEVEGLQSLGVNMLVNQSLELRKGNARLCVIGLDDPHYYGCDDLPGAMQGVHKDAFKILLVHTPEMIREAAEHKINLYLCGHTHGGQICLPLIGPLLVNANCPRKYIRGMWRYKCVQGYTSAGVGSSCVPVRFFCPPEIGVIELRRSNRSALK